jgi:hypothetical protein
LTMFEATAIGLTIVLVWFGTEARDRSFLREAEVGDVTVSVIEG